ncbi:MAG: DUF3827 domain-containing protein [Micrococcales bacterium]|nr:DUF3827 domain-containing protein [Micrococcales bacterium]
MNIFADIAPDPIEETIPVFTPENTPDPTTLGGSNTWVIVTVVVVIVVATAIIAILTARHRRK